MVVILFFDRAFRICPVITIFGFSITNCPISDNGIVTVSSLVITKCFKRKLILLSFVNTTVLQLILTTVHFYRTLVFDITNPLLIDEGIVLQQYLSLVDIDLQKYWNVLHLHLPFSA